MTQPETKVFKLLESETILQDEDIIHPGFIYIVDGKVTRYSGFGESTVGAWKTFKPCKEVRKCSFLAHEGIWIGARVEE
jgi:hypothetical protein